MDDFDRLKAELLQDPATRRAYEAREPAFELASRLIELRRALGLTQRQLASMAKMTQPEIARLESAQNSPTWDTVARVLGSVGAEIEIRVRNPAGKFVKLRLSPGATAQPSRRTKPAAQPAPAPTSA